MTNAPQIPPHTPVRKRKPNRFEMTFLMMFHGILTGGVLLTYISGDDIYFLHQFAGYVVCGAVLVRLLAAAVAPKSSPLRLHLPKLFAPQTGGRSPWLAWIAVAMIAATAAAAFSGLMAESIGFDDLHEVLANGLLPMVIAVHVAVVLRKPLLRWLDGFSAEDKAQAAHAARTVAHMAYVLAEALVRWTVRLVSRLLERWLKPALGDQRSA